MRYLLVLFTICISSEAMSQPTKQMIAGVIDHTYLKTLEEGASVEEQRLQVQKLVLEAHKFGAFSVCVREHMVEFARKKLDELGSSVKLTTVVGFPKGDQFTTDEKIRLVRQTREDGADEYDMVMRYIDFKDGKHERVYRDIVEVSKEVGNQVLKVIVETSYLNDDQKKEAYALIVRAFRDSTQAKAEILKKRFLKTSTGFAKPKPGVAVGATISDIEEMHLASKGVFGIKPAGGVSTYEDAIRFFNAAGAPYSETSDSLDPMKFRIGTSSLLQKLVSATTKGSSDY